MNIQTLTTFFMWCTIIDGGILVLWGFFFFLIPDFIYGIYNKWFPMPRETYTVIIFSVLGLFKIFFLIFNVIPYVALLIIG